MLRFLRCLAVRAKVATVKVITGPAGEDWLYLYRLQTGDGASWEIVRWGRDKRVPVPGSYVWSLSVIGIVWGRFKKTGVRGDFFESAPSVRG